MKKTIIVLALLLAGVVGAGGLGPPPRGYFYNQLMKKYNRLQKENNTLRAMHRRQSNRQQRMVRERRNLRRKALSLRNKKENNMDKELLARAIDSLRWLVTDAKWRYEVDDSNEISGSGYSDDLNEAMDTLEDLGRLRNSL